MYDSPQVNPDEKNLRVFSRLFSSVVKNKFRYSLIGLSQEVK